MEQAEQLQTQITQLQSEIDGIHKGIVFTIEVFF